MPTNLLWKVHIFHLENDIHDKMKLVFLNEKYLSASVLIPNKIVLNSFELERSPEAKNFENHYQFN